MTAQHTQGRLKVQHPHSGERGWEVAFEPGLEQVCQNITEKNARRLAACWNACDGLDTYELERFGLGTAFGSEIFELRAQRDELLEAAKLVIAWFEAEDDHSKADFYQRMEMCRSAEEALRAVIAKHQPTAAPAAKGEPF